MHRFWTASRLIALSITLFAASSAQAATITVDASGILLGATGVTVSGQMYDVAFIDGTCADAYGVCDEAHFVFTTESAALAASWALLDQVFLDGGLGNFDSDPTLTNGCFFPNNCWALTPYQIMGANFLITQTANIAVGQGPDGAFVHQPLGPGLSIADYDASNDINGVSRSGRQFPTRQEQLLY